MTLQATPKPTGPWKVLQAGIQAGTQADIKQKSYRKIGLSGASSLNLSPLPLSKPYTPIELFVLNFAIVYANG